MAFFTRLTWRALFTRCTFFARLALFVATTVAVAGLLATVAAFFLFRERLARVQIVGVAVIAVGVAVLTALQA